MSCKCSYIVALRSFLNLAFKFRSVKYIKLFFMNAVEVQIQICLLILSCSSIICLRLLQPYRPNGRKLISSKYWVFNVVYSPLIYIFKNLTSHCTNVSANGLFYYILIFNCSLLAYRHQRDVCIVSLYPKILLNSLTRSTSSWYIP